MLITDSHCHLDYFTENERIEVLQKAGEANIVGIVSISTLPSKFSNLLNIVEKHNGLWCSAGLHPCHINDEKFDVDIVAKQAMSSNKVVAIGETGLDYLKNNDNHELQKKIFIQHIELAQNLEKILVVHTRNADDDTYNILKKSYAKKPFTAILHCYSGNEKLLNLAIELKFFVSFSGILTFKNCNDLRLKVKSVPSNQLLVETDAPYLSPQPFRGKRNHPANIIYTLDCLAQQLNQNSEITAKQIFENFCNAYKVKI